MSDTRLDKLPTEILALILDNLVILSNKNKNDALPARLICKRFDAIIRTTLFKTIQLDFDRISRTGKQVDRGVLESIGEDVKCVSIDLAVIRSQSEIKDLKAAFSSITGRIPDTARVLESLASNCMGEETFDESDFVDFITDIFIHSPNLAKIKVSLPFKIVGQAPIHATTLFANLLSSIAGRDEDHAPITTLVICHLSDTTLNKLYNNPMDLVNAFKVFKPLNHLVINFKRQEHDNASQAAFQANFQRLLGEASILKSLCLTGWNANRLTRQRATQGAGRVERDKWAAQCLPYRSVSEGKLRLGNLRYMELKRVDIHARSLLAMLFDCSKHLKELYLNQVYLKHDQRTIAGTAPFLWIGYAADHLKNPDHLWVADEIKKLRDTGALRLTLLRATGLGYDYINPAQGVPNTFDLEDPSGLARSFDERFVQRAMGLPVPALDAPVVTPYEYDTEFTQMLHNTTSGYLKTMDGVFQTYNTQSLSEITKIIEAIDDSMQVLNEQLEEVNDAGEEEGVDGEPMDVDDA